MEPRQHNHLALTIRAARREDAPRMAEVYVTSWRDAYPILLPAATLIGMSVERWTRQFAWTIVKGREIVLVAEDAKHGIIGLATAGRASDADLKISSALS